MAQADWAKQHVRRYRETNGENGHIWTGQDGAGAFPCLLLTTNGRRSNEQRTTPLIYGRDGDDFIIIASQGGRPTHPGWYHNLCSFPEVEVQVLADVFRANASTVGGDNLETLWGMMAGIYPPYDAYREKAASSRQIPLVALSPL